MKANGIITLGEALIDFIPLDNENLSYAKSPGGAPANVAVGIAKLGGNSTFIGKVGDDIFGTFLEETLTSYGVKTEGMHFSQEERTGIVFVTLDREGERSFEFYINRSADQMLEIKEIDKQLFKDNRILHIGSISLIHEPVKGATEYALKLAKENKMLVSFDPNIRLSLWQNEMHAKETILSILPKTDVLKLSEEEAMFLTGEDMLEKAVAKMDETGVPLVVITCGKDGSLVVYNGERVRIPAVHVKAVDTTGAGDAYTSALLYQLHAHNKPIEAFQLEEVIRAAEFASVSGALAVTAKGAMTALPASQDIELFLRNK